MDSIQRISQFAGEKAFVSGAVRVDRKEKPEKTKKTKKLGKTSKINPTLTEVIESGTYAYDSELGVGVRGSWIQGESFCQMGREGILNTQAIT